MQKNHIGSLRLAVQRATANPFDDPAEVVRWMGAMQAQDYGQALWAIAVRTKSATLRDVELSISEGKIVRTWPQRGTIHFVAAEDAKWMVRLSEARMVAGARGRQAQLGLTQAILDRSAEILRRALDGGKRLSRPSVMGVLEGEGIATTGGVGYHILWYLAQIGLICIGPMEGRQQTFVLLDRWAPGRRDLSREQALTELASRYFTSHGPATVQDFAWWAGLTLRDARAGLQEAGKLLVREVLEGEEYWLGAGARSERPQPGIQFLPGFDEFLLGYKDRTAVLAKELATRVVPGGNGVFKPMIVENGRVIGTWKRTLAKTSVTVVMNPFSPLQSDSMEIARTLERYRDFTGCEHLNIAVEGPSDLMS